MHRNSYGCRGSTSGSAEGAYSAFAECQLDFLKRVWKYAKRQKGKLGGKMKGGWKGKRAGKKVERKGRIDVRGRGQKGDQSLTF